MWSMYTTFLSPKLIDMKDSIDTSYRQFLIDSKLLTSRSEVASGPSPFMSHVEGVLHMDYAGRAAAERHIALGRMGRADHSVSVPEHVWRQRQSVVGHR